MVVGEHKSTREQTGCLTMSEADRLHENEQEEEKNKDFEIMAGKKIQLGTQSEFRRERESVCYLAVTHVHTFDFSFRSAAASKCKCQCG